MVRGDGTLAASSSPQAARAPVKITFLISTMNNTNKVQEIKLRKKLLKELSTFQALFFGVSPFVPSLWLPLIASEVQDSLALSLL